MRYVYAVYTPGILHQEEVCCSYLLPVSLSHIHVQASICLYDSCSPVRGVHFSHDHPSPDSEILWQELDCAPPTGQRRPALLKGLLKIGPHTQTHTHTHTNTEGMHSHSGTFPGKHRFSCKTHSRKAVTNCTAQEQLRPFFPN